MNSPSAKVRVICHLFGCDTLANPFCVRCGTDLYDVDFVQIGKLEPLFNVWWRVRRKLGPKYCEQCGKKFVHGYDNELCSEECHERWIPF